MSSACRVLPNTWVVPVVCCETIKHPPSAFLVHGGLGFSQAMDALDVAFFNGHHENISELQL